MDNPIWAKDLFYIREMIVIMIITVAMITICFYYSNKAERRRAIRLANQHQATVAVEETPQIPAETH